MYPVVTVHFVAKDRFVVLRINYERTLIVCVLAPPRQRPL
jgi:hypothetical protein